MSHALTLALPWSCLGLALLLFALALSCFSLPLPCLVEKGDPSKDKEKSKGGPRKENKDSVASLATDGRNRLIIFPFFSCFSFFFLMFARNIPTLKEMLGAKTDERERLRMCNKPDSRRSPCLSFSFFFYLSRPEIVPMNRPCLTSVAYVTSVRAG